MCIILMLPSFYCEVSCINAKLIPVEHRIGDNGCARDTH